MSFLNLPWQWDFSEVPETPIGLSVRRWRRGPVTFYRYVMHIKGDTQTSYWLCLANDLSIGVHLPAQWGFGATASPSTLPEQKP
jgi:hypothetical protein